MITQIKVIISQVITVVIIAGIIAIGNNLLNQKRIPWVSSYKNAENVDNIVKVNPDSLWTNTDPATSDSAHSSVSADEKIKIYVIDLAETYKQFQSGKTVFIDARYPNDYKTEHIKGSINLPADMFDEYYPEVANLFSIDDPLVIYCSGPGCDLSAALGDVMRDMGYTKIMLFEEGFPAWKKANYPTE